MTEKYSLQLFQELKKMTEGFPFEVVQNEPAGLSENELREHRLRTLVSTAKKMGERKYYEMPESFRADFTREEWIHEALFIFFEQTARYDPRHNLSFNRYILKMVKNRLISKQRELFRKNPPAENDDLRKIAASLKRELGRDVTAEELSEHAGIDKRKAEEFLDSGVRQRVFERRSGEELDKAEVKTGISPEEQYIRLEARKILWDCIRRLESKMRLLFIRHEFFGISFQKLFDKPEYRKFLGSISLTTFQRDYKKRTFDPVENCVRRKYEIKC